MQPEEEMGLLRDYAERKSEEAFAAVVSQRVNFVYSAALRQLSAPDAAKEVTQTVFIVLARKAGQLPDGTILSGWLFRTTRFVALAYLRAEAKRRSCERKAHMELEFHHDSSEAAWEEIAPLLDEALTKLGEKDRQAILLRFFDNKSLADVGQWLGTTENSAGKRVSRALEKLRRRLLQRGVATTAAGLIAALSAQSVAAAPVGFAGAVTGIALAQGTSAYGQSLILIKGALKMIAWTKAKTAGIAVTILLVAGSGTWVVTNALLSAREPSYQGRLLLEWLADVDFGKPEDLRARATTAIQHMGRRTLPFLLMDLSMRPPSPDSRVRYLRPDMRSSDERARQAVWAFVALGAQGKSAIPELERLLDQMPGYAPEALGGIGRDALPVMFRALTNEHFWVRDNTVAALANALFAGRITGEEARPALAIALANLTYDSTNSLYLVNTRSRAATLLGALKLDPDLSVPALIHALQDTNLTVQMSCAMALGQFRSDAIQAVNALEKTENSTDPQLRRAATMAISMINNRPLNP